MTVKIDSVFATADVVGTVLGVPAGRVRQLSKLVDTSMAARRANGNSHTDFFADSRSHRVAITRRPKRRSKVSTKKSFSAALGTRLSKRSQAPKRIQRRAKKSKSAR